MLQLRHSTFIPYEDVYDYYNSFNKSCRYKEMTSFSLLEAKNKDRYLECITYFEKFLYYLIDDENPSYILGHTVLSINFPYADIAYAVRTEEREKGYGTLILKLAKEQAKELGIEHVYISCFDDNIGSKKVIENNNAEFIKKYIDRDTGRNALSYTIALKKKL